MNEPSEELSPETKKTIKNKLFDQLELTFEKFENSTRIYTQHIFIVNAGGSAATLAFLGTETGSAFAIWPLMFFVVGVIACGISLRASCLVQKAAFYDALGRRVKFSETEEVEGLFPEKGEMEKWASYRIAYWADNIAHLLFIAGVITGGIAYFV